MRRLVAATVTALHLPIVLAPWVAPHSPIRQYRDHAASPPSLTFPLGTDDLGRDIASRVLHGSQVSLAAGALATAIAVGLAALIGAMTGLSRGVDAVCSVVTASTMAVPWMFLLLAMRSALPLDLPPGGAWLLVSSVVGVVSWGGPARLCRAALQHALTEPYVLAARAAGATRLRVLLVHAAPVMAPVIRAQAMVLFPQFVLAEVSLSFLGLGTAEPWPSLGTLLADARNLQVLSDQPWRLAPAAVLVVLVGAYQAIATAATRATRPFATG